MTSIIRPSAADIKKYRRDAGFDASNPSSGGTTLPKNVAILGTDSSGNPIDDSFLAVGQGLTVNQDAFLAPYDTATLTCNAGTTSPMGTANRCRVMQFNLNRRIQCTKAWIFVTTTSSGNHEFIGLYSKDGNTLLGQWTFTLEIGIGLLSATIPSIILNADAYYLVRGADQTTSVLAAGSFGSPNITAVYNGGAIVRYGDSPNPIIAGNLPAALGIITASSTNPPVVMFEP